MKLSEKDIITLRVEGTGFAAKTDEKVRRDASPAEVIGGRAPHQAEPSLTLRRAVFPPCSQALVVTSESRPVARF